MPATPTSEVTPEPVLIDHEGARVSLPEATVAGPHTLIPYSMQMRPTSWF